MKHLLRAWHLALGSCAAYLAIDHGRRLAATFARPEPYDVQQLDHPAGRADDDVTALAVATGVMPELCPHMADDQAPELNAHGGTRFCGLPAGHAGTEHPSLVEPAAADR
jgi:hypothetical protein